MNGTQALRDAQQSTLKRYLLSHEDDIFNGINDFGDLRALFYVMIGKPVKIDTSTA